MKMALLQGIRTNKEVLAAILIIAGLLIVGQVLSPGFASPEQLVRQLTIAAILGTVAAGQNLVILGGREGIDLSVGAQISLAAVAGGDLMHGNNALLLPGVLATLGVGACVGLLNGIGVTRLRIPPLVMTLGMLGVIQGGLVVVTNGIPSGQAAPALVNLVSQPLLAGLPGVVILWCLIGLFMAALLHRSRLGFRIYAVGSNEQAAMLAGIPVLGIRTLLFALSGVFSALAGLFVLGYTGNSFIGVGESYMLPSIIAVVIGGTSLRGGIGAYWGTMAGAVILTLLQSILTTLQLAASGRQLVFGATLLVLMLFYGRQGRLRG